MTIAQLREERAEHLKALDNILARADAETGIPKTDFDAIEAKIKRIDEQLDMHEKAAALAARKAVPIADGGAAPLAATPKVRSKHYKDPAEAHRVGQWCRGFLFSDRRSRQWCVENGVGNEVETRALSGLANPAGGFLVPDEMSNAMIDLREQFGVARQLATVFPMTSDTLSIPRRQSGVTATFIGESTEYTESDPSWSQVKLTAKKLAVETRIPTELLEDVSGVAVADWVTREHAYAFAVKEDQCLIDGDGSSTYGGIVGIRTKINDGNYIASRHTAASNVDTFPEITLADVNGAMGLIPAYADAQAFILCSNQFWNSVLQRLAYASGGVTAAEQINGVRTKMFQGYPVITSQVMPTSTTTDYSNVPMMLFGAFPLAIAMGERRGFRLRRSDERYIELDQIALFADQRFDIVVHSLGSTTEAGPVSALIGQ